MAPAYLTEEEAQSLLAERYGFEDAPYIAMLEIASDEVDAMGGPWIGGRYGTSPTQQRAFPRSVQPDGTTTSATTSAVPDPVRGYVALRALQLSREPEAPISSKSAGDLSISYAGGKQSKLAVLTNAAWLALVPWRRRVGSFAGEEVIRKVSTRTV